MTDDGRQLGFVAALKQVPDRIKAHNVVVTAAGIAFFGLLALVPTLIAIISVYGLVNNGNEDEIKQQIEDTAGALDDSTKEFLADQLTAITTSDGNLAALVFGILLALFSASGAVQKMMGTIGVAYHAEDGRAGWKVRLLAYALTFGAVLSTVLMVTVFGIVPAVLDSVNLGTATETGIRLVRLPVMVVLLGLALTVLYRYGPDRSPRTPWLNPGAAVATVLWTIFALAFSLYSSQIGAMPASYGLLGTLAALMIFLQLTALAVIVGAEYNAIVEEAAQRTTGAKVDDRARTTVGTVTAPPQPVSLGKALVGLAALFILGRD
jgi:membrane protein